MIPLPDWTRLQPRPLSKSTVRGGGCGDCSGCILGCGGLIGAAALVLWTAKAYGWWVGLAMLVALGSAAAGLSKVSRLVSGLLLGALFAAGVWLTMRRDYAHEPWKIALGAALAFALFSLAGYWEQKYRAGR